MVMKYMTYKILCVCYMYNSKILCTYFYSEVYLWIGGGGIRGFPLREFFMTTNLQKRTEVLVRFTIWPFNLIR